MTRWNFSRCEQRLHARAVGEVELARSGSSAGCRRLREPRLLQRHVVVVVEIVEADDFVAALEQPLGDVEADEAGGAGDEEFHEGLSVRTRS